MTLTKCNIISLDTGGQKRWENVFKFCKFDAKYFKGPLKLYPTSRKLNLILNPTNLRNSIKTMKSIVFTPKFNAVRPG